NLGGLLGALLFPWAVRTDLGWRTLYFLGVIPVVLVILLRGRIRETRRFAQERAFQESRGAGEGRPRSLMAFRQEHRRPLVAATSLWFMTFLWTPAVALFFAYYVINERAWGPEWVSWTLMLSFIMGVVGSAMAGPLADRLGRRPTAYLYYGLG
ncbi:MAG: MFS transporter, partial [Chloroflexota bacterium]